MLPATDPLVQPTHVPLLLADPALHLLHWLVSGSSPDPGAQLAQNSAPVEENVPAEQD